MDIISEEKGVFFLKSFAEFSKTHLVKPGLIKDWHDLAQKVRSLKEYLKENSLAVIICLHAYGGLLAFLEFISGQVLDASNFINKNIGNESQRRNLKMTLSNILNLVYNSSYECFLKRQFKDSQDKQIKYKDIFRKCMKAITVQKQKECSLSYLLIALAKIQIIFQPQERRKNINSFIIHHLTFEKTHNAFQEIAFNWIKKQVERIQNENPQYICCHILFEKASNVCELKDSSERPKQQEKQAKQKQQAKQAANFSQTLNQQFKDYRWPLENQSIKNHLTKTIVGYLNTTGGIIYVGLKEDKKKMIEVKGIKLNSQQKIDFLYFLHNDIMKGVFPKEPDRKKDEQDQAHQPNKVTDYQKRLKEQFQSNNSKFQYRINKYVHVDFIDIYDKDTLLNSREEGCSLYIARIKIKIGDCRELYHIINAQKQIPQAYFRQEKSVRKKNLQEFYNQFYERMKNKQAIMGNAKVEQHPNCRFNIRCTET